jgi:hypothetical protein
MTTKIRRPKVNLPSQYKIWAMLSPSSKGKIDRKMIHDFCDAVHSHQKHRSDTLRKMNRDSSDE